MYLTVSLLVVGVARTDMGLVTVMLEAGAMTRMILCYKCRFRCRCVLRVLVIGGDLASSLEGQTEKNFAAQIFE